MKRILTLSLTALLAVQAQAGGSWGEPTQPTKPATTNDTGDYTGGGGKFGGTGAGGSWGDDYSGGGGKFGGSGAGGAWNSSSSSSSSSSNSGASCTNDGWEFEYIVLSDRTSFNSLEQACRYVWSNSFLNKKGYKETRQSGGSYRGKYYRKIEVINDWSARCYIHVGNRDYKYDNNIGGYGIYNWDVAKYYKGKVEICDPETMPPIPNFPMPPTPNTPTTPNTPSGSDGNTGTGGNGGNTNNYNHTTNNYKWDITTNNHNTTNNTNHITNNHGISDDKINQLIIAIKNNKVDVDLTALLLAINSINNTINNLDFNQVVDIENEISSIILAIKNNKYDDTDIKNKIDVLTVKLNNKLDLIINKLDLIRIAISELNLNVDLSPLENKIDLLIEAISNQQSVDVDLSRIEKQLSDIHTAIIESKYDDTKLQAKIDNLAEKITDTNSKLDTIIELMEKSQTCNTEFNKKICEWLDNPSDDSDTKINIKEITLDGIDKNRISYDKSCPSDIEIPISYLGVSNHLSLSMQPLCDGLGMLRPIIIAAGSLSALFILLGVRRGSSSDWSF